jgi:hypothetical protein
MRRFSQFRHGDVGARKIRIAETEVDHVATVRARVGLESVDLSEDVGR